MKKVQHVDKQNYEILVEGQLDPRRARWFEGMAVQPLDNGTTAITGPVADQAALHGLLNRIRDLGLTLIAVRKM